VTVRANGATLGCLVSPSPLNRGLFPQPIRCLRGGAPALVCGHVPELHAPARAPWSLARESGFPSPITLTLQGLLEDSGAANALHFSTTNAIVLRVN
jgi:hypothetical protein